MLHPPLIKINKRSRAISWTNWHNIISPLYSIRALKCKFRLAAQRNSELMKTLRRIPEPHECHALSPKLVIDCRITPRDRIRYNACHTVQRDVVNAKSHTKLSILRTCSWCGFGASKVLNNHLPLWIWRMWPTLVRAAIHLL